MPRSRQLSVYLAALCALLLAAASCSDGDDERSDPQPTTTAPATTTTVSQEEEDEQALRELAEDWFEVAPTIFGPDGDTATAADYLVDPYLSEVEEQAADYRDRGVEVQVTDRSRYEVESIEVEGETATLVECIVDGDRLVESTSGDVINDATSAFRTSTTAVLIDGEWRLSERTTTDEFEGQDACFG